METPRGYEFLNQDQPNPEIMTILGQLPARWGRMDQLSRLVLVKVGRILKEHDLLDQQSYRLPSATTAGLVAGTRRGSLQTDLAYCYTLKSGADQASPTLFSYTLANISLAEAAAHYGLTGPVYGLFSETPYEDALKEAERWLNCVDYPLLMVAGEVDIDSLECQPVAGFTVI